MKDLDWLKEEINELPVKFFGFSVLKQREEFAVIKDDVLDLINQLDEPEVLSPEWIDNHTYHEDEYDFYYADPDELKNLLVPKQEEITESFKETVRKLVETSELAMDVRKLTGMTLEEIKEEARNGGFVPKQEREQKYYVILEENSYGAMGLGIGREGRLTFTATHDKWSLPKLTEQEIKDYDERFWPFAVKVEELEE